LPGAEGREKTIQDLLTGSWTKEPYWKLRGKGSCHDIFFLSALSQAAGFTAVLEEVAAKHAPTDIGGYLQPMVQGRGCHCEFNLFSDDSNLAEKKAVERFFYDASETLMRRGAFFSRP